MGQRAGRHYSQWDFLAGDFCGDGTGDIVAFDRHFGQLSVAKGRQSLEGYAWPLSGAPGERIRFFVSGWSPGGMGAQFIRFTADASAVNTAHVGGTRVQQPKVQFSDYPPWRVGAKWHEAFDLPIPLGWTSGIYAAVVGTAGNHTHIPFIVKPSTPNAPRSRS